MGGFEHPKLKAADRAASSVEGGMGKYEALRSQLAVRGEVVQMTFQEVADIVGGLPPSAFMHSAWWSNEVGGSHVQAHAWMGAGFRVDDVDLLKQRVRFRRSTPSSRRSKGGRA
jgi:hypothetical protein